MDNWIWSLVFSVLGSSPEHGQLNKFKTKAECEVAIVTLRQTYKEKNKEIVATCVFKMIDKKQ